jgi:hypothetical protein
MKMDKDVWIKCRFFKYILVSCARCLMSAQPLDKMCIVCKIDLLYHINEVEIITWFSAKKAKTTKEYNLTNLAYSIPWKQNCRHGKKRKIFSLKV